MTTVYKYKHLLIIALLAVFSGGALAQPSIIIATDVWEGFSEKDGSGYYTDTMKAIFEAEGINVVIKYVPYARSVNMISTGQADAMLGAYQGHLDEGVFGLYPLDKDIVDVAITPELAKNWQGQSSLAGKRVAALRGYDMEKDVSVKIQYKEVSNIKSLLKMLNKNRIDAVLGYEDDFSLAQNSIGEVRNYEIKKAVVVKMSFPVFANTAKGNNYQAIYNKGMLKLHESGKLKELMLSNAGSVDYYPL